MNKEDISKALQSLAKSISSGQLDSSSLNLLAENYEFLESNYNEFDDATKLRLSALQPFIAEKVGLPSPDNISVVMKNWGRQGAVANTEDEIKPGDTSIIMKNWGRQGKSVRSLTEETNKDMSVVMKNWGRQ